MAKKRERMSEAGVTLTERTIFGGSPRVRIGTEYVVTSKRAPDGRVFDTLAAAKKYYKVQVGLRPKAQRAG